jgi:hypothetical protein
MAFNTHKNQRQRAALEKFLATVPSSFGKIGL